MNPRIGGTLRLSVRLSIMAIWMAAALIGFHLWNLFRARNPWPRLFLGGIARIIGVRLQVRGRPAPGRRMMLANHVSWIDIPALAWITGTAFVAQDGLAEVRLLKWLCDMNNTVFVARHDRAGVGGQIEALRTALLANGTMTVFPEGTTNDGSVLWPFKSSLLAALDPLPADITVQPVWLDYGAQTAEIAWVGVESGMANFKRMMARASRLDVTVHFLEPLPEAALATRKTITGAARQAIAQAMVLQKTDGLP